MQWSTDGNDFPSVISSTPTAVADGSVKWVRGTLDVDNESGQHEVSFYVSDDGSTWSPVGVTQIGAGTTTVYNSATALSVAGRHSASFDNLSGKAYYGEIRNGIDGAVVAKMDPSEKTDFDADWTSSAGEVWTINRSGLPEADIRSDLTVSDRYGVGAGSAFLSYVDGVAAFAVTAPASIAASTPILLGLDGFTNTPTPGSYTSSLRTYDNAGTPAVIDGPTASNSVTFDDNTTDVTVANARSITFSNDTDSMTMLMDPSTAATSDRTSDPLTLVIATNSGTGYSLAARATSLQGGGHTLARVNSTGTVGCSPIGSIPVNSWSYHVNALTQGGAAATALRQGQLDSRWCGYATSDVVVVIQSAPTNGDTVPIRTKTKIDYLQPATTYTSTITYTAVPSY